MKNNIDKYVIEIVRVFAADKLKRDNITHEINKSLKSLDYKSIFSLYYQCYKSDPFTDYPNTPDSFSKIFITHDIINSLKTDKGGFSNDSVKIFGLKYPLTRGWKHKLIGSFIDKVKYVSKT